MTGSQVKYLSPRFLDDKLKAEKDYWLEKLSGELVVTGVPLDFIRPSEYVDSRGVVAIRPGPDIQKRLIEVCGKNDALILTTLLTSLKICLHKYSGQEDILVGTAIHERYSEVASLNKVLALRDQVKGANTVKDLLLNVKSTLSEAYANQKYPLFRILDHLKLDCPNNREPLFNVILTLESISSASLIKHLKTDVVISFSVKDGGIAGVIEYSKSLFRRETLDVFERHYCEILRSVLNNPHTPIAQLELAPPDKARDFTISFNNTRSEYPKEQTVHQLFEDQAQRTPDAEAVCLQDEALTYSDLDRRANQCARYLNRMGVGPGKLVGIYMEHRLEVIVALLGVLKCGAGYVPLDPSHPKSRIAFTLKDAEIPVVLTQSSLAGDVLVEDVAVISLDSEWGRFEQESDTSFTIDGASESPAYVIYTSGSTGEPKGVKISQASLINYVWWAKDVYLRGESLDFPLYSSLAFDLTVTSIFTPLITGNRVIIYPNRGMRHPIVDVVRDNRAGVLKLTPSHMALLREVKMDDCRIKRVIVGGEAFETRLATEMFGVFGEDVEIFNEYGPTEATVGCMIHKFDPEEDSRALVPIGRPVANTQIYVLDENLNPTAENVSGEIYISGDGLAQEYLNREELTAQRFVDNPFVAGQKMYKTGDVARRLPEGIIEYIGRKDGQVKFHGYRVELNEIRSVLNRHPKVSDSVIVVAKGKNDDDVMIAYYVSDQELEVSELRSLLQASVIEETIPSIFAHLEALPITTNGKVDYQALPTLEEVRRNLRRAYVAPVTPTEEVIAGIWSQVLGIEQVSVEEDFFELGGHSLLASQIISRARKAFQIDIPLRALFDASTVAGLAKAVEAVIHAQLGAQAPPIEAGPRNQALPLSFAQQRLWFINQIEPDSVAYNIYPVFRLSGNLDVEVMKRTINEIVRRHEALRTTFMSEEGRPVQLVHQALTIELPVIDLSEKTESERDSEVRRLASEEVRRPFDLEKGPLLRAMLARLNAEEHLLFLAMHHIISDGWSIGVFYKEIAALYKAYITNIPCALPNLPIQYADYALWQRQWLQGEVLEAQLAYWKNQLKGAPDLMDLSTARPRKAVRTSDGEHQDFMFDQSLSDGLKSLSRREGTTLFMTLLAAFKAMLSYYANRDDIVVGSDVANRNRPEIEGLIGFFVNTLVLRTDLSGDPSFRELLGRVREVCLSAYGRQDIPFEKLVEELNPDRKMNRNPLFQVMFGLLQEDARKALDLPGLTLKPWPIDNRTSVFDFSLYVVDTQRGLGASARYSTDLFDSATIRQMVASFEILLENVVSQPTIRLSELKEVLIQAERQRQTDQSSKLKEARLQKFQKIKSKQAATPHMESYETSETVHASAAATGGSIEAD